MAVEKMTGRIAVMAMEKKKKKKSKLNLLLKWNVLQ